MKKVLLLFILMIGQGARAEVTTTVGPSGSYANLRSAFAAINDGTLTGAVILQVTGSFTEPDSAVLNASGSGAASYTSVLIYPVVAGCVIHGNIDRSLIRLDGADHVTIDGRVNLAGQRDMVVENINTAGRCLFIYNAACYNVIQYCILKGSYTEKTGGVIALGPSKFATGNDYNIIDHCDIGPAGVNFPNTAVCSLSLTGKFNREFTVSNNDIHDFRPASVSDICYGIFLNPGVTASVISGNSFYQTSSHQGLANKTTIIISITDDIDHKVTGNYLGGSGPLASGTWSISTPAVNYKFIGILVTGFGSFSIESNVVKNIYWLTTSNNQAEGSWCGILVTGSCSAMIGGPGKGNTIGDAGEGSVTIKAYGNGGFVTGIMESTSGSSEGDITIAENTVGSIKVTGNTASISTSIRGIGSTGTYGTKTITNNLVGSLTQANSIWSANPSTSSANQSVYGIQCTGDVLHVVTGNTISNLTNSYAYGGGTGYTRGISLGGGANLVSENSISNLFSSTPNISPDANTSLIGIACLSFFEDQTISGNIIKNLVNTASSAATRVTGIYFANVTSGNNSISGNSISALTLLTSSTGGSVTGIKANGVAAPIFNNAIMLGKDNAGVSLTTGYDVTGIFNSNLSNDCYFNTILIEGENVNGSAASMAFHDNTPGGTCRNNIFINTRTNSATGTGKHYCIYSEGTPLASDHNNLYAMGAGTVLGSDGSDDYSTLAAWQNATGQDAGSFSEETLFAAGSGLQPEAGYYLPGETVAAISTDIAGNSRAGGPDIGAWEGNEVHWTGAAGTAWSNPANWDRGTVPSLTKNAILRDRPVPPANWPVIENTPSSPATCNELVIGTGASVVIPEGKALTVASGIHNQSNDPAALQLLSSASGKGSLIFQGGSPEGTVAQYIEGWTGNLHGWHFLSSPVANQPIRPGFVPADPMGYAQDLYQWNEALDLWINSRSDDGSWNIGFESTFTTGKGYLAAYQNTGIRTFTGTLNSSSIPVTGLTRTEESTHTGWHLLGNPFTSAIAWNDGSWSLSDISGVAKIWNEANASYTDIPAGAVIPAAQGFMAEALAEGASLVIPASARKHDIQPWYKSTGEPVIRLSVHDPAHTTVQESVLCFDQLATTGFDAVHDGHFLAGHAPLFYSLANGERLSTNALPGPESGLSVTFCFSAAEEGDFILRVDEITGIAEPVTLTDLSSNSGRNLRSDPEYYFHYVPGDDPVRFLVTFAPLGTGAMQHPDPSIRLAGRSLVISNPGNGTLELIDLSGRALFAEHMDDSNIFQKTLDVAPGVYLVRVCGDRGTHSAKIMVLNR